MKTRTLVKLGKWCSPVAILLASCTGDGLFQGNDIRSGGLKMDCGVDDVEEGEHFCFSWTLYQETDDGWEMIDQREEPICGEPGDSDLTDFATCYDGRRFLVEYSIQVFDETGEVASVTAISGGGPDDLCVKNTDTDTTAHIQLNDEGNAGGVNPGFDVDEVCSNDKVELENGQLVSALWLQPDGCVEGETPNSYCALGTGEGLETVRFGITPDGLTRYIFSTSDLDANWDVTYVSFEGSASGSLELLSTPWALHHFANGSEDFGREEIETLGSYRMGDNVGLVTAAGSQVSILYSQDAPCDGPLDLNASEQLIDLPACAAGAAEAIGLSASSSSGSGFDIIYSCGGELISSACDAAASGDPCENNI